jgi:hypothetical protein
MVDDRDAEIKHLKGRIIDLSPGIFKMSLMTRIFATVNFVLILAAIVVGVNFKAYLELEVQKHYSNEIIEERERAWESILKAAERETEHYKIELEGKKEELEAIEKSLDLANEKNRELEEKLRK